MAGLEVSWPVGDPLVCFHIPGRAGSSTLVRTGSANVLTTTTTVMTDHYMMTPPFEDVFQDLLRQGRISG